MLKRSRKPPKRLPHRARQNKKFPWLPACLSTDLKYNDFVTFQIRCPFFIQNTWEALEKHKFFCYIEGIASKHSLSQFKRTQMKKTALVALILLVSLSLSAWSWPAASLPQGANPSPVQAAATPGLMVDNKTGAGVTITLSGPANMTFIAGPGKTTKALQPGKYRYSYRACGANRTGNITIAQKSSKLTIAKCVTSKVTISNDTGGTLTLTLSGPANYTFNLGSGKTKITVIKGKYTYTGRAYCGSKSGTYNLTSGFNWRWWCY
jgi:hypothetical protein